MATMATRIESGRLFIFELGGAPAGWIKSVEGGNAAADVITEAIGTEKIKKKHLGNVRYEDITITCGAGMSKDFYQWIQAVFNMGDPSGKNGAIITLDPNYIEVERLEFANALITEVSMPALDAAGKEPVYMTIKIIPESTRRSFPVKGNLFKTELSKPSLWVSSNFKLNISGLEAAKVHKIDPLTLKQKVTQNNAGERRGNQKEPVSVDYSNLCITFPDINADIFYKWHEDFVIKGNNSQDKEKSGTLLYLDQRGGILFQIKLDGLGIFRLSPVESSTGDIRRFKAEMYCERMGLNCEGTLGNKR